MSLSAKVAALYFDRVVPLYIPFPTEDQKVRDSQGTLLQIRDYELLPLAELLPPALFDSARVPNCAMEYVKVIHAFVELVGAPDGEAKVASADACWKAAAQLVVAHPSLHRASLLFPRADPSKGADDEDTLLLTLSELPLIDAAKAPWDKIIALRKDLEAKPKLRRLRLDLVRQYQGKSRSFIQDDLLKRLDDYENVIRDWGFETRAGAISQLGSCSNHIQPNIERGEGQRSGRAVNAPQADVVRSRGNKMAQPVRAAPHGW